MRAAGEGTIHLSFAARPEVCGSGRHSTVILDAADEEEWEGDCERGPVRVSLRIRAGRVASAETWVGGRWRRGIGGQVTDLGMVPAREAAGLLLDLATGAGGDGEQLISAAVLADSAEVWPRLLRIARDDRLPGETRGLDSIVGDPRGNLEVRKQAVFSLSQRPADEGVPALIRVVRTSPDPELRRTALFWLGQSDDPRALSLFEEILR